MNESETLANLKELGEAEYQVLKQTYCKLQALRADVSAMHEQYLKEGTAPDFDYVESVHLQMEELYGELERFLLPICSVSGCGPAMCEPKS